MDQIQQLVRLSLDSASLVWLVVVTSVAAGVLMMAAAQALIDVLSVRALVQGVYLYAALLKRAFELDEHFREVLLDFFRRPRELDRTKSELETLLRGFETSTDQHTSGDWPTSPVAGLPIDDLARADPAQRSYYWPRSKHAPERLVVDLVFFPVVLVGLPTTLALLVLGMVPMFGRGVNAGLFWMIKFCVRLYLKWSFYGSEMPLGRFLRRIGIFLPGPFHKSRPSFGVSVAAGHATALADYAAADLVRMATSGDPMALFGLPVEQFAGQLGVAVDTMMAAPRAHVGLLFLIAQGAAPADLRRVLFPDQSVRSTILGPEGQGPGRVVGSAPEAPRELSAREREAVLVSAAGRVAEVAQRSLDSVQITLGSFWETGLLRAAMVVVFLFAWTYPFGTFTASEPVRWWLYGLALAGWLSSGFFAMLIRGLWLIARDPRRRGR